MEKYKESLFDRFNLLSSNVQTLLSLYSSLVYLGNKEYKKARKSINQVIMRGKNIYNMPLYRTFRLVNLMIYYVQNNTDYILSEIRTVKRDLQNIENSYEIENLMLVFFNKSFDLVSRFKRNQLWKEMEPKLTAQHDNKFELPLLRIFDFTAWIESKIRMIPLDLVLQNNHKLYYTHQREKNKETMPE